MSDRMSPIPFDKLITWILAEYAKDDLVFGIPSAKFYKHSKHPNLQLFGTVLENPLGPAAGPNTQLAQNIIAAYLAGSRFFELKTVQILDGEDLPVAKPCISAIDEGYNVEWSTELTVADAFAEYVKAWFVLHILAKEFGLGSHAGFIFNMSVGYDLAGIQSVKIDTFINGLKDASETEIWQHCQEYLLQQLDLFQHIDRKFVEGISPKICASITLSTLHGCPPVEIERIAKYLLEEKRLHTYVKCNPTLLGYQFARETLDKMGYEYLVFDEHHFQNDLQFDDAIPMFTRLKEYAKERHLSFGVKLSNTFPVQIHHSELPGKEMYMSGRALYPLTINLAYLLAKEFGGDLRISYSGGADFFNIANIYQAGIWPITFATTILKPGGYLRIHQMAELLDEEASVALEQIGVNVERLEQLAKSAIQDPHHQKDYREVGSRKLVKKLPLTDCFIAPCKDGCPIDQDIPEYIRLVGAGKYLEALELIVTKNPLPFITGTLCNHRCMTKCTRIDYDQSVEIRATKLVAAEKGFAALIGKLAKPNRNSAIKVAVIGAGPAGLAAAYFLGQQGVSVTVFDRKDKIGGIIEHIAPDFRIPKAAIDHDMELVRKMGAEFQLGVSCDFSVEDLKKEGFQYIFIAIGAWNPGLLKLKSCDREIINVLQFLEYYNKRRDSLKMGKKVAVIGAGNSAMDAARAAKRVAGVEDVYVIYRRTQKYMPADREELRLALADGVEFKELLAPVSFDKGILRCQIMELGAPDLSGRRSPVALPGEFMDLQVDTIIAAVGEMVESEFLTRNGIAMDDKGRIRVNPETNQTSVANVFVGGDALRGPATIVEAIADGTKFAKIVLKRELQKDLKLDTTVVFDQESQLAEIRHKKGLLQESCKTGNQNQRCLECNVLCNLCVEVCPNRANVVVKVSRADITCYQQILHMDGMCNECGNCAVFCPYDSAPFQDKLTLYWTIADFNNSKNAGFVLMDEASRRFKVRLGDEVVEVVFDPSGVWRGAIPNEIGKIIWTAYRDYRYLFCG
jgi:putative selenate reductase